MNSDLLYNPVYNALSSRDAHLGGGSEKAKYYHADIAPFAGFPEDLENGFQELYQLLPPGRKIVFATPETINEPAGWQTIEAVSGLQFLFAGDHRRYSPSAELLPLNKSHIDQMIVLTRLTRPGPFSGRTIEFGHYYGVFDGERLVAMTGQRMHIGEYTEVSAVCTHPDYLGKGYAAALISHQVSLILDQGYKPFLHVRDDNARAIALYERIGFKKNRPMNFSFMMRKD